MKIIVNVDIDSTHAKYNYLTFKAQHFPSKKTVMVSLNSKEVELPIEEIIIQDCEEEYDKHIKWFEAEKYQRAYVIKSHELYFLENYIVYRKIPIPLNADSVGPYIP